MIIRSMTKVEWYSNTKKIFNWVFFSEESYRIIDKVHEQILCKNAKKIAKIINNTSLVI